MKRTCAGVLLAVVFAGSMAWSEPATNRVFDPYFLGYEAEPAMDYGGRDIVTLHSGMCRTMGWLLESERRPYLTPIYEWIFAAGLSTVQHEVFGHGSRAREFSLDPSYGFGLDFSGSTSIGRDPKNNEQNILLAAGGTEGDSIMAHRILLDLYTGDGTDGSKIPLMALAKIDFSLYCLSTADPGSNSDDFRDEYEDGNDMAYYLVSRQAQRRNADPADVWNEDYTINFSDPYLSKNYDDLRAAAVWNMADPAALAAMYGYIVDHVIRGRTQVRPPVIPFGGGFGLTAGTRAFAGAEEVTRFLDLYLVTPGPLLTVYGRDLQSSLDQSFGWGGGVYGLKVVKGITVNLAGNVWTEPDSLEGLHDGTGWNACGELNTLFNDRWGFSCKVGNKSDGYFPGTPLDSGVYAGAGVRVAF